MLERNGQKQDIPDTRHRRPEHHKDPSFLQTIREIRRAHGRAECPHVRWRRKQQRLRRRPRAERGYDRRRKDRLRVDWHRDADVHGHQEPCLPVGSGAPNGGPFKGSLRCQAGVVLESLQDKLPLQRIEKPRLLGPIMNHPRRDTPNHERQQPFNNKDPRPAVLATHALHLAQRESKDPAKRAAQDRTCKEQRDSFGSLLALVPSAEEETDAGKQAAFKELSAQR